MRWAIASAGCNMRNAFLALLVVLAAAPLAWAQQYPQANMQPNPYAQPGMQPNPYAPQPGVQPNPYYGAPPPNGPQVQRVQYPYGSYGYSPAPVYAYPQRGGYAPNYYGYNTGYGVNYYYVQNPYTNYAPYRPAVAGPLPAAQPSWPQPSQPLPPVSQEEIAPGSVVPLEGDPEGEVPAPAAGISFRRATAECLWSDAGYTATFMRPMHMNGPLATTGSTTDAIPGALGQPSTLALFGDKSVDFGLFSGARAELGIFLDHENRFSLEVGGFILFPNTSSFFTSADQNGNPVISRPYFNIGSDPGNGLSPNEQFRFANSLQGFLTGTFAVDLKSQMEGFEFNARFHSYIQDRYHIDLLGGFRYLRLDESLQTRELVNALPGTTVPFAGGTYNPPDFITDQDNFRTINQFIGSQLGARLSWEERWFTLDAFAKLALGATLEHADINGSTTLNSPTGTQTANGGVLALPSNSGSFNRTIFGVVPECGFDLGVNITQYIRVKLGYSFLYWNHVDRPGSQYDLNINPGQVNSSAFFGQTGGPPGPAHRFNDEVFWTNSFNLGLEVHF
jgi:hypothetical protein